MQQVSLADRYDLEQSRVLLNGTQALVRLMLMQKARDVAAGFNTAGLITGYRGSPLGAVDMQVERALDALNARQIIFQPGLNEDLAATALWGAQQAELRGEGKFEGVFGLWYGKGPGIDRSGDVMRHANMAGTSALGGVLMAMGDDHTGESSTVLHQSEFALIDSYMPVLSPAGVQEILDYGLYGFALSRFAGVWAGLKTMKDTVEVTSVVDGDPHRLQFIEPDFDMPAGGLNIRLVDDRIEQEARLVDYKRRAAMAFAQVNQIDRRRVWGGPAARIGFVAAGKNWLDLVHAMSLLNIDGNQAHRLGITTYKVGQVWPLDVRSFQNWAEGLDLIVVIEEKRKLIEGQIKEALFNNPNRCRVYGEKHGANPLFSAKWVLDPAQIAQKLGEILCEEGRGTEGIRAGMDRIEAARRADNTPALATRLPYFCSGCPHNSSTTVPAGSRAYAGIGCHFMVQWMDRETLGFTHMGAEGANWIGEAPFSKRTHMFQNIGDGTYNHSGIQAIRAAVAAGTNITYKILYNDAVAMTGGQGNDGDLSAKRIVDEVHAMGVQHLAVVYDAKEDVDPIAFARPGIQVHERAQMQHVQEDFAQRDGVSVIVYIQTCAAEKRRRRKRGHFPDPDKRVFINPRICEGCGDCGVQSNCVSIIPLETELGRKRAIDQSACNKDFSCVQGFCPSFVTLQGAHIKKAVTRSIDVPDLPDPQLPQIDKTWSIVITGVGGTGVVTIGAIIAQAAHIDGMGVGVMEMAGLAQKGGAVHIHCRLAENPQDISAIRVATGEADALIGGDLVVSAEAKTLDLTLAGHTRAVVNSHEIITGEFTRDTEFRVPFDRLQLAIMSQLQGQADLFDASELARVALGDSIFSNTIMFGAAWQRGLVPLSLEAVQQAIRLNGAAVEGNLRAFELGRWAIEYPAEAIRVSARDHPQEKTTSEQIIFRAGHLEKYQNKALSGKFQSLVDTFPQDLRLSVAKGYHKVLAYKDEYEVARLLLHTRSQAAGTFEGDFKITYHLAPPFLAKTGPDGRPQKRAFGAWLEWPLRLLAGLRRLRGTRLDVFGYAAERKMERALIVQFESDMAQVLPLVLPSTRLLIAELAELPLKIRGFGPVKMAAKARADQRRDVLLAQIRAGGIAMHAAAE